MTDAITRPLPWRDATATIWLPLWMEQQDRMTAQVEVRVRYRVPLELKFLFTRSPADAWELEWDATLHPFGSASGRHARSVLGPLLAELLAADEARAPLAELHGRAPRLGAMKAWERLHQARTEAARAAAKVRATAAEFEGYGVPEGECARLLGEFHATGDLRRVHRGPGR